MNRMFGSGIWLKRRNAELWAVRRALPTVRRSTVFVICGIYGVVSDVDEL
jgi:hypothetical protein